MSENMELTRERLLELQALPLERKVGFTAARIAEWYNHYNGKVHVSFSGGKDSTVLLYLVRKLFPDVRGMFVDTGLEYPEIRDFVKTWTNVDWVRPAKTFLQIIREYGYPVVSKEVAHYVHYSKKGDCWCAAAMGLVEEFESPRTHRLMKIKRGGRYDCSRWKFLCDAPFPIGDQCCDEMKKKTAKKYSREHGTHSMLATMTIESRLREKSWLQHGCNAFDAKEPKSTPMAFWTEQDVLRYIKTMNIPIASVYGKIVEGKDGKLCTTGCSRTGCMFCCFGVHREKYPNRFQQMYKTHPKQWDYCINKLGLKQVLDYIHVPYLPVENDQMEFDFENDSQK